MAASKNSAVPFSHAAAAAGRPAVTAPPRADNAASAPMYAPPRADNAASAPIYTAFLSDGSYKPRKKRGGGVKAAVAAAAVVGAAVLYIAVNVVGARVSIARDDFKTADTFLKLLVIGDQVLEKDRAYVDAGLDLLRQHYSKAQFEFTALGTLYRSPEFVLECQYRKAASESGAQEYDAAIALYLELGDYKDSAALLKDTKYRKAADLADGNFYEDAIKLYTELGDYKDSAALLKDTKYRKAADLADGNFYEDAIKLYTELGDYKDSAALVKESRYSQAAYYCSSNAFDKALALYRELGDYKDSEKLLGDTLYDKGYYLIGIKKYAEGIDVLSCLQALGYPDCETVILDANYQCGVSLLRDNNLVEAYDYLVAAAQYKDASVQLLGAREALYNEGILYYHDADYDKAKACFTKTAGYARSDDYLLLCGFHLDSFFEYSGSMLREIVTTKLAPLIGFEDAGQLAVSSQLFAEIFLTGTWSSGYYYFTVDSGGSMTFYMPSYDGDYYRIVGGIVYSVDESGNQVDALWKITVLTKDSLSAYVYKNKSTYTLYHK